MRGLHLDLKLEAKKESFGVFEEVYLVIRLFFVRLGRNRFGAKNGTREWFSAWARESLPDSDLLNSNEEDQAYGLVEDSQKQLKTTFSDNC